MRVRPCRRATCRTKRAGGECDSATFPRLQVTYSGKKSSTRRIDIFDGARACAMPNNMETMLSVTELMS